MWQIYAPLHEALKVAAELETAIDAAQDSDAAVEAQVKLAQVAAAVYDDFRVTAAGLRSYDGVTQKEATALQIVDLTLRLRERTGEKVAADATTVAFNLMKLAEAVIVDETLSEQLPMLEGSTRVAAEQCQSLGREYILTLLGELLA